MQSKGYEHIQIQGYTHLDEHGQFWKREHIHKLPIRSNSMLYVGVLLNIPTCTRIVECTASLIVICRATSSLLLLLLGIGLALKLHKAVVDI